METTNADGNTPLHVRVLANDLSSVMALLTTVNPANTLAIGQNGNSALHMAVQVSDNFDQFVHNFHEVPLNCTQLLPNMCCLLLRKENTNYIFWSNRIKE